MYGIQEIGDTPKFAFTDKETPKAIIKRPNIKVEIRRKRLFVCIFIYLKRESKLSKKKLLLS
jgi:hypothetical protein